MSEVTVEEVENLCKSIAEKRLIIDEEKSKLTEKNKELDELEAKAVRYLEDLGKKSYKSEHGTVSITEKWRVNLPQTDEDKMAFFEYLRQKGLFEKYATVNSNSLNSYFIAEWEAIKQSDPEAALNFRLPGICEPKLHKDISFRKK
jgi:hypothetical protein